MSPRSAVLTSVTVPVLTAVLAFFIALAFRGQNYSDNGIVMFSRAGGAFSAGIGFYLAAVIVFLFFLRKAEPKKPLITAIAAGGSLVIFMLLYLFLKFYLNF